MILLMIGRILYRSVNAVNAIINVDGIRYVKSRALHPVD